MNFFYVTPTEYPPFFLLNVYINVLTFSRKLHFILFLHVIIRTLYIILYIIFLRTDPKLLKNLFYKVLVFSVLLKKMNKKLAENLEMRVLSLNPLYVCICICIYRIYKHF